MRHFVGEKWRSALTRPPQGASLSPKRPNHDRRDLGVYAAVWGGTGSRIIPDPPPPRSVPIPKTGHARLGGLGCITAVEDLELRPYPTLPRGIPIP